jgi:hypothetical protein
MVKIMVIRIISAAGKVASQSRHIFDDNYGPARFLARFLMITMDKLYHERRRQNSLAEPPHFCQIIINYVNMVN